MDYLADLKSFVAEWHHPIETGDGSTETEIADTEARLGFRLPEALRELYALIGKREDITSIQNRLVRLDDLGLEDGWLVVWEENQCVTLMAIREQDLSEDNPLVWVVTDGETLPHDKPYPVSEFALMMVATEIIFAGPNIGTGSAQGEQAGETDELAALRQRARSTPYPILTDYEFSYLDDVLLYPMTGTEIWIAARNRDALISAIERYDKIEWSYTSLDDE